MKKIICTLAAIVALSNITLAQTEKSVGSVEIDVIDQYKASIKKATKISNQPDFVDSTTKKLPVQYRIYPEVLVYTFTPEPIQPVKVKNVKLGPLPKNMIKLGGGMYGTSLAEILLSSSRKESFNWQVGLNHFGTQKGVQGIAYDKSPMMENNLFLAGRWLLKDYRLKASAGADWNRYSYYGMPENFADYGIALPELAKNDYQRYYGSVDFDRVYRKGKSVFEGAGISYHYFANNWKTNENLLHVKTNWSLPQEVKENKLGAELNVLWLQNNRVPLMQTNSQFNVQFFPKAKGKYDWFSYTAGINFNFYNTNMKVGEIPTKNFNFYVFPEIAIGAELVRDVLAFFAGWSGEATTNSQYSLGKINPYVLPGLELMPTRTNRIFAGLEGAVASNISYKLEANLRVVSDMVLFQLADSITTNYNGSDLPAFNAVYVDGGIFQGRGEVTYNAKQTTISGFAELNSYNLKIGDDKTAPFQLPKMRIGADVKQTIREKFEISAGLAYVAGRQALSQDGPIFKADMKNIFDVYLGVGYNINSNLSAGVEFTNLISQQYEVCLSYPSQRFRALVYLTYKF
jgi:hypothetical protein